MATLKNVIAKESNEIAKIYGCVRMYFSSVKKETEKAIFVSVVFENENSESNIASAYDFWIPKSMISENEIGVVIPSWFINKNFSPKFNINN